MEFDNLSRQVIGCAIEVHKTLGAGLLESTYEKWLYKKFMKHKYSLT
jgi:GxxExxY protein